MTHNMQQAKRASHHTAFFTVIDGDGSTSTGTLVEFAETGQLFEDPDDDRTRAYVEGSVG